MRILFVGVSSFTGYHFVKKLSQNKKNKITCTLTKNFNSYKNIFFLGWLNNNDLNFVLKNCDYGLMPYNGDDFDISYPNKLAEYLSNNLKIITCVNGITKKLIIKKSFIQL